MHNLTQKYLTKKNYHYWFVCYYRLFIWPYFNDLSAWSKAHCAGSLRACPNPLSYFNDGKMVGMVYKVVPILLMGNGCVLGITCNKPIRVLSPIPFKSELNGGILRRTD